MNKLTKVIFTFLLIVTVAMGYSTATMADSKKELIIEQKKQIIELEQEIENLGETPIQKYLLQSRKKYIARLKEQLEKLKKEKGLDEKKQAYNINADTAAGALAKSLKSRRLMLMTDVEGVYDKSKKLISEIKSAEAEKLIYDETISEGMIPKIRTCIDAVNNGVRAVAIIDGRKPHSILFELFSDKGSGTLIRK